MEFFPKKVIKFLYNSLNYSSNQSNSFLVHRRFNKSNFITFVLKIVAFGANKVIEIECEKLLSRTLSRTHPLNHFTSVNIAASLVARDNLCLP